LTNSNEPTWLLDIPSTMIGSPEFTVRVYSKTITGVLDSIESLIRKPYGCFEQASMTTYPMVIALELLKEIRNSINDADQISRIDAWI